MWHATASQYNSTSKINTKEKKTMTPFEKIIKEHLEKKAGSDAVFAEKFIERCKADQKAIEGCCAYITAEARKKAQNGCAVIADDEVFGWAMHHCVFSNGYYKKEGILVLTARKAGVRLETIELDTKAWRILQCRGRFNKESAHHKEILSLIAQYG